MLSSIERWSERQREGGLETRRTRILRDAILANFAADGSQRGMNGEKMGPDCVSKRTSP